MTTSPFPDLVRAAIADIEARYTPILEKARQAQEDYTRARAQVEAETVDNAVVLFGPDPFARAHFIEKVQQLPELEALARAGKAAIRQLAQERQAIAPIQNHLRGFVTGLRVLGEAENEIAAMRARGEAPEGFRLDMVTAQRASQVQSIERIVTELKALGWKPTAKDFGVIGAAKKALQPTVKKAA